MVKQKQKIEWIQVGQCFGVLLVLPGFAELIWPEIWNPMTIDEATTTNRSIRLIGVLMN